MLGARQSEVMVVAAIVPCRWEKGMNPQLTSGPFVQLFISNDFISPLTPPLRKVALFPFTDVEMKF